MEHYREPDASKFTCSLKMSIISCSRSEHLAREGSQVHMTFKADSEMHSPGREKTGEGRGASRHDWGAVGRTQEDKPQRHC